MRSLAAVSLCVALIAGAATPVNSQQPSEGRERVHLDLTGYYSILGAGQDLGYDVPVGDRTSTFLDNIVRLKWSARIGETIRISLHNRLQSQYSSASTAAGGNVIGIGVSTVPARPIDLSTDIRSSDHLRVVHDIDRLTLRIFTDAIDLTVGRQGISWGISNLFPVADLWAQFSPYELDTEEKPGVDAIRGLLYPADGWEIDAVVAARGSGRDFSAGLRATAELDRADVYFAAGKFWRRAMGMTGISMVLDSWILRGEIVVPWNLDTREFERARATLGADYLSADLFVSFEYHHNGLGADDRTGYLGKISATEFARGETYYLGRYYLGGAASYRVTDRISTAASTIVNLRDGSGSATPSLAYSFGDQWRASGGALLTFGTHPTFTPFPTINSEFGSYGRFGFVQVSVYF